MPPHPESKPGPEQEEIPSAPCGKASSMSKRPHHGRQGNSPCTVGLILGKAHVAMIANQNQKGCHAIDKLSPSDIIDISLISHIEFIE